MKPELQLLLRQQSGGEAAAGTVRLAIHLQSNNLRAAFSRRLPSAIAHVLFLSPLDNNPEGGWKSHAGFHAFTKKYINAPFRSLPRPRLTAINALTAPSGEGHVSSSPAGPSLNAARARINASRESAPCAAAGCREHRRHLLPAPRRIPQRRRRRRNADGCC